MGLEVGGATRRESLRNGRELGTQELAPERKLAHDRRTVDGHWLGVAR